MDNWSALNQCAIDRLQLFSATRRGLIHPLLGSSHAVRTGEFLRPRLAARGRSIPTGWQGHHAKRCTSNHAHPNTCFRCRHRACHGHFWRGSRAYVGCDAGQYSAITAALASPVDNRDVQCRPRPVCPRPAGSVRQSKCPSGSHYDDDVVRRFARRICSRVCPGTAHRKLLPCGILRVLLRYRSPSSSATTTLSANVFCAAEPLP